MELISEVDKSVPLTGVCCAALFQNVAYDFLTFHTEKGLSIFPNVFPEKKKNEA